MKTLPSPAVLTPPRATLIGLTAILLWSMTVGLIRSVTEQLGTTSGAALIYSVSALLLVAVKGWPRPGELPRRYLWLGGALFIAYEALLALAIGMAHSRSQSLEIGMINYLWPCLTLVFAVLFNGQRARIWLWPGALLSFAGVVWVMKGDGQGSPQQMLANIMDNPVAYGLALLAALLWATYCTVARRDGGGKNGVTLFFLGTALVLWLKYAVAPQPDWQMTFSGTWQLLLLGAATATAYSCWNTGIQHGNLTLLATASYFTPVLSALVSCAWLGLVPGAGFWQGVVMVTAGSLICWRATA